VEQASGFFLLISAFKKPIKNEEVTWQTQLFAAAHRFIVSFLSEWFLNGFKRFDCNCKILSRTSPGSHIDLFVCICVYSSQ